MSHRNPNKRHTHTHTHAVSHQVNVHHAFEGAQRQIFGQAQKISGRIVNQNAQVAKSLNHFLDCIVGAVQVADVANNHQNVLHSRKIQSFDRVEQLGLCATHDGHLGPMQTKLGRNFEANARTTSSDESNLAFQNICVKD